MLENGYCIGNYEIHQIFDLIGMKEKVGEDSGAFFEFMEHLA